MCAFLLALAASAAIAQPPGTNTSYVAIQIKTDTLDMPSNTATTCGGVVVDEKKKFIATAWHCVPNSSRLLNEQGAFMANGSPAKLVTFSAEADMAILVVVDLKGVKAPKFVTPKKGEEVVASAFYDSFPVNNMGPNMDRYFPQTSISVTLDWKTEVAGVAEAQKREPPKFDLIPAGVKWIVMSGNPAPGFSGAPVFDRQGGFVGIISNGNGGFTNVSSSENVQRLFKKLQ
jgi:hypothetical protein